MAATTLANAVTTRLRRADHPGRDPQHPLRWPRRISNERLKMTRNLVCGVHITTIITSPLSSCYWSLGWAFVRVSCPIRLMAHWFNVFTRWYIDIQIIYIYMDEWIEEIDARKQARMNSILCTGNDRDAIFLLSCAIKIHWLYLDCPRRQQQQSWWHVNDSVCQHALLYIGEVIYLKQLYNKGSNEVECFREPFP